MANDDHISAFLSHTANLTIAARPLASGRSSTVTGNLCFLWNIPEEGQIRLSEKTGLPVGVLDRQTDYTDASYDPTYDGADTYMSVNKGVGRSKKETPEEKKLRKLQVKKERQLARMQKKMMKEAFNDEFSRRQHDVIVDDVGGKSVFRF